MQGVPASGGASRRRKLRKPRRLGPGSVIGVAAPAGPVDRVQFDRGVEVLRAMEFEVRVPPEVFAAEGYLAGPDARRAAVLERLLADPAIDAVICARGGYGSLRILPLLDYARLAAHPKILIGFSDITALLAAVSARCGFAVFHGPMVTTLAAASGKTLAGLAAALVSEGSLTLSAAGAAALRPGRAAGPVCGGNLTTLCHLLGTPFAPRFAGRILFLEDRGEAPYRIDRLLAHLRSAGCLEKLAGVVLGSFTECGEPAEIRAIFEAAFRGAPFPVLAGLEAGHAEPNLTLPIGVPAVLDAEEGTLAFECATE